jgi:hypothetical protein
LTSDNVYAAPAGSDSTPAAIAAASERVGRICGAVRREDTLTTVQGPLACGWRLTWTSDDVQLAAISDGATNDPDDMEVFHNRVYLVRGMPTEIKLERVPAYPNMVMRFVESKFASYWGSSILAVDGQVYRFVKTSNHPYLREDGSFWPGFRMHAAKLIYSPDNGVTWNNQDGTHPVVWENWDDRSHDNMLFFGEQHPGLAWGGSFLQMGRDYSLNSDGYIYAYFGMANGDDLSVYRAPRSRLRDRSSYEFFTGRRVDGTATWSSDLAEAAALHRFPPGWVSSKDDDGMAPAGWSTSVVYNPGLGVYLLAAQGVGVGDDGGWFAKPSYLGFWAAPTPWGPFTQFHEESAWTPGGNPNSRAFVPDIAPKWISPDGRSFWLVWSDYEFKGDENAGKADAVALEAAKNITDDAEFVRFITAWIAKHQPSAVFHTQRVDLTVR